MSELTEAEKGYLAGMMDADGCISIASGTHTKGYPIHSLRSIITSSDKSYLEYWRDKLDMGAVHKQTGRPIRGSNRRRVWYSWQLGPNDTVALLRLIGDHLILKRDQAKVALAFMELPSGCFGSRGVPAGIIEKREAFCGLIRDLKHEEMVSDDEIEAVILDIIGAKQEPLWAD